MLRAKNFLKKSQLAIRLITYSFFLFLGIFIFSFSLYAKDAKITAPEKKSTETASSALFEKKELTLRISPEPVQTMKLLTFQVKLKGYQSFEKIQIDLSMPGMVMGINRFFLKKKGVDDYEGNTIIPTCPSGKRTWLAKVIIDHTVEKEVIFNVQK